MAKKNTFSIGASVSYGWKQMKKNFKFFAVLLLIVFAINIVPSVVAGIADENGTTLVGFLAKLIGWGLQLLIGLGSVGIALRIYDKKKVAYKNLFDYVHLVIPYLFASIVYTLIVVVGLILLVVPGIIWGIKFRYFTYFMVDKNMGPVEALKASAKITKGNKWNLFFLGIVLGVINILGVLAVIVGLFVTAPIAMMAEAYVFRKLTEK